MLYIVATPIGNLEDITFRAVRTLKEAHLIAAEDTRHAKILLNKYEIKTPLQSFHAHSDDKKLAYLLGELKSGKNIALITDAGTPGISDPGYVLIKAAVEEGIQVVPVPGPAAFLTALSASGLPTHRFVYLGFLPQKKGRQTLLNSLTGEDRTIVFYESNHRILKTLSELHSVFGHRQIVIARELTKIHEEYYRGTAREALIHFGGPDWQNPKKQLKPKGEIVVMIAGE